MSDDSIVSASAPGKLILLGEHAVVYGKPAIAIAIDKRFECTVFPDYTDTLNGIPIDYEHHPHIKYVVRKNSLANIGVETDSYIPSGSGLGSSGALSSALAAAIREYAGLPFDKKEIAKDAFEAEYYAQGKASPMDTSCCTFGRTVALNYPFDDMNELMTMEKNGKKWSISGSDAPDMTFVIGYTGIKASTTELVAKVKRYTDHSTFASDIVDEIEFVTIEGMKCIKRNDPVGLGKMMTEDHKLLSILGTSCNELNKLVNAALMHSYGAKLTGAGGGGSIVALTDEPEKVCEDIFLHGGLPFIVKPDTVGVRIEEPEQ